MESIIIKLLKLFLHFGEEGAREFSETIHTSRILSFSKEGEKSELNNGDCWRPRAKVGSGGEGKFTHKILTEENGTAKYCVRTQNTCRRMNKNYQK